MPANIIRKLDPTNFKILNQETKRKMFENIYIAKGIGISLVVLGHYLPEKSPDYWKFINNLVYSFHMPLFFWISGYLLSFVSPENYLSFVQKKATRLMIPFFSVAFLFFCLKLIPSLFIELEHPITFGSLSEILIRPVRSYMPLLWFVYTLFIITLIYPILEWILKRRTSILWLCIALSFLPMTSYFSLNLVFENLPYFACGALLSARLDLDEPLGRQNSIKAVICLAVSVVVALAVIPLREAISSNNVLIQTVFPLLAGFSGVSACLICSVLLSQHASTKLISVLIQLGFFSMSIYLFHPLFESSVRVVANQILDVQGFFELKAGLAIAAGLIFPLLIEKYGFRKFALSRKLILGMPS